MWFSLFNSKNYVLAVCDVFHHDHDPLMMLMISLVSADRSRELNRSSLPCPRLPQQAQAILDLASHHIATIPNLEVT